MTIILLYFSLPNSRTVSNKRTGWKICQKIINAQDLINAQAINKTNMTYKVKKHTGWEIFLKLINAQCLISSHRADFFLKKNKRTCAAIRQAKVLTWVIQKLKGTCYMTNKAMIVQKIRVLISKFMNHVKIATFSSSVYYSLSKHEGN